MSVCLRSAGKLFHSFEFVSFGHSVFRHERTNVSKTGARSSTKHQFILLTWTSCVVSCWRHCLSIRATTESTLGALSCFVCTQNVAVFENFQVDWKTEYIPGQQSTEYAVCSTIVHLYAFPQSVCWTILLFTGKHHRNMTFYF